MLNYRYTIQRAVTEDGSTFRCTVKEFPDVVCYGDHPSQVYWLAVDAVEGLVALAEEMGHDYPKPEYTTV